jgi:2',3'-cyclic-nucleotide 2'-phosphodiesterase/3'-nucleotidase
LQSTKEPAVLRDPSTKRDSRSASRNLLLLSTLLALSACGGGDDAPASAPAAQNATAQLALLETTDLHYYVRSYNYYSDRADNSVGLERTATLIRQARTDFPNNLLVDNGDTIQGSVLGTYEAQVVPR